MPFDISNRELILARKAAVIAVKKYGLFNTAEEHARFLANPWNDHVSIQAAIEVIKLLRERAGIPDAD